jgi:hypothetical protein
VAFLFRGAGTAGTANNAATLTPGLPTGWQPGDLHVLQVQTFGGTGARVPQVPDGWNGTVWANGTAQHLLAWRIAQSGDTAPTVTMSGTGVANDTQCARVHGFYSNLTAGVVVFDAAGSTSTNSSADNIGPITGVTVARANSLTVISAGKANDFNGSGSLTNYTQAALTESTDGNDAGLTLMYRLATPSGATGNLTVTDNGGTASNGVGLGRMLAFYEGIGVASSISVGVTTTSDVSVAAPPSPIDIVEEAHYAGFAPEPNPAVTFGAVNPGEVLIFAVEVHNNGTITPPDARCVEMTTDATEWPRLSTFKRLVQAGDPTTWTFTVSAGSFPVVHAWRLRGPFSTHDFQQIRGEKRTAFYAVTGADVLASDRSVQANTLVIAALTHYNSNPASFSNGFGGVRNHYDNINGSLGSAHRVYGAADTLVRTYVSWTGSASGNGSLIRIPAPRDALAVVEAMSTSTVEFEAVEGTNNTIAFQDAPIKNQLIALVYGIRDQAFVSGPPGFALLGEYDDYARFRVYAKIAEDGETGVYTAVAAASAHLSAQGYVVNGPFPATLDLSELVINAGTLGFASAHSVPTARTSVGRRTLALAGICLRQGPKATVSWSNSFEDELYSFAYNAHLHVVRRVFDGPAVNAQTTDTLTADNYGWSFLLRIPEPYTVDALANHPQVIARTPTRIEATTGTLAVRIGSPAAGDLVVIPLVTGRAGGGAEQVPAPTGWTNLAGANDWNGWLRHQVMARVCDGTEGDVLTLTPTANSTAAAVAYRYAAGTHDGLPNVSTPVLFGGVEPDASSVTLNAGRIGASVIAAASYYFNEPKLSTAPAGYGNALDVWTDTNAASLMTADREVTGTAEDPGPFTSTGYVNYVGYAIAVVRPLPSIATLYEPFDGTALPASFTGAATVANAVLNTRSQPALSAKMFAYTGHSLVVCLSRECDFGGSAGAFGTDMMLGVEHPGSGNINAFGCTGTGWAVRNYASDYGNAGTWGTFTPGNRWLRIDFGATQVDIYTSADGATWTLEVSPAASDFAAWHGRKLRLFGDLFTLVGAVPPISPITVTDLYFGQPVADWMPGWVQTIAGVTVPAGTTRLLLRMACETGWGAGKGWVKLGTTDFVKLWSAGNGNTRSAEIWELQNPPIGTFDVTFDTNTPSKCKLQALAGDDAAAPVVVPSDAYYSDLRAVRHVAAVPGALAFDVQVHDTVSFVAADDDQLTEQAGTFDAGAKYGFSRKVATRDPVTMAWIFGDGGFNTGAAVVYMPSGDAPTLPADIASALAATIAVPAEVRIDKPLASQVSTAVTTMATVVILVPIEAATLASLTTAGAVAVDKPVASVVGAQITLQAALGLEKPVASVLQVLVQVQAAVDVPKPVAALVQVAIETQAAVSTSGIAAALSASLTTSGAIGVSKPITAVATITVASTAQVVVTKAIEAAVLAAISASADIAVPKPIASAIAAVISAVGSVGLEKPVVSTVVVSVQSTADVLLEKPIASAVTSSIGTLGAIGVAKFVASVLLVQVTTEGELISLVPPRYLNGDLTVMARFTANLTVATRSSAVVALLLRQDSVLALIARHEANLLLTTGEAGAMQTISGEP